MNAYDRRRRRMSLTRIALALILIICALPLVWDRLPLTLQMAVALLLGLPIIAILLVNRQS